MARIVVVGLTGDGALGGYETQLGNVAIVIPMFRFLRDAIPGVQIATTIQLSDAFCAAHGVTRIVAPPRARLRILRGAAGLGRALLDLAVSSVARVLKRGPAEIPRALLSGRLRNLAQADVVLDFNGDTFPTDVHPAKALLHAMRLASLGCLGVPVIEFVSSPGPFDTPFRRLVSRLAFSGVAAFANREAISSELTRSFGVKAPVVTTACPAWMLQPIDEQRSCQLLRTEGIDPLRRPLVGVTLAGYNLHSQRSWDRPRHFDDLVLYLPALRWLLEDLGATLMLLPHVYRQNPFVHGHEHINGPDHDILKHLREALDPHRYGDRLRLIEGKYSAAEAKGMIGRCDLYLSGRLHAAVAALSQSVPTVLLAYGHKHRGFARIADQERFVFDGRDPERLKALVKDAWADREAVAHTLGEALPRIREMVELNFRMVREVAVLPPESRRRLPPDVVGPWIERSAFLHGLADPSTSAAAHASHPAATHPRTG